MRTIRVVRITTRTVAGALPGILTVRRTVLRVVAIANTSISKAHRQEGTLGPLAITKGTVYNGARLGWPLGIPAGGGSLNKNSPRQTRAGAVALGDNSCYDGSSLADLSPPP